MLADCNSGAGINYPTWSYDTDSGICVGYATITPTRLTSAPTDRLIAGPHTPCLGCLSLPDTPMTWALPSSTPLQRHSGVSNKRSEVGRAAIPMVTMLGQIRFSGSLPIKLQLPLGLLSLPSPQFRRQVMTDTCTCVTAPHFCLYMVQSKLSLSSQHMLGSTQHSIHHNSSQVSLLLQDQYATEDSLYTKALQIAALESLTNALDYGSIPTGTTTHVQLPYANSPPNKPLPGSSWLPLSATAPLTQHNSVYMDR